MKSLDTILFKLISLGLDESGDRYFLLSVDWECLWKMASLQGVSAIVWKGYRYLTRVTVAWQRFLNL